VPARAGVERRSAALAAVRLPLLLEATAGMLETSPPSGSAGRALRTTGFWGWSTHRPPGLRLRDCTTSGVASESPALRCWHGPGRRRAVCGGLQDEEAVRPKLPEAASKWEARPRLFDGGG